MANFWKSIRFKFKLFVSVDTEDFLMSTCMLHFVIKSQEVQANLDISSVKHKFIFENLSKSLRFKFKLCCFLTEQLSLLHFVTITNTESLALNYGSTMLIWKYLLLSTGSFLKLLASP